MTTMRDREFTPPTDAAIKAMFDQRARRADAADLRRQILAVTDLERQDRNWSFWLPLRAPQGMLRGLVLALIAAAIVATTFVGVAALRTAPLPPPPTLPAATPAVTPTATPRVATGVATDFIRPFKYSSLPSGTMRLTAIQREIVTWISGADIPARTDLREPPPEGTPAPGWAGGVVVGSAETAWSHGGKSGRFMLRTAPAEFLADLRDTAGVSMSDMVSTTLDDRPALSVDLPGTGGTDIHVNGPIDGLSRDYVMVNVPARLIVADIDGATVFVLIWGFTKSELDTWLPIADEFVKSIHFIREGQQ